MPTIPAEFPDIAYYMERVRKLEEANDRLREQSAEHTESRGMMGAEIRSLEAKLAAATACISETVRRAELAEAGRAHHLDFLQRINEALGLGKVGECMSSELMLQRARIAPYAEGLERALNMIVAHHIDQNMQKGRPEERSFTLRTARAALAAKNVIPTGTKCRICGDTGKEADLDRTTARGLAYKPCRCVSEIDNSKPLCWGVISEKHGVVVAFHNVDSANTYASNNGGRVAALCEYQRYSKTEVKP